jgi:hypothetical protein
VRLGPHSFSFFRPQKGVGGLPEDAEKEVGLGQSMEEFGHSHGTHPFTPPQIPSISKLDLTPTSTSYTSREVADKRMGRAMNWEFGIQLGH